MKISVFTPLTANGNRYIAEVYASLLTQTHTDWEWIVLENHGGILPDAPRGDSRVKVYTSGLEGIGALKRQAAMLCTGAVRFELDHDDILHCQALERTAAAITDGADFVYSDFAEFKDDTWEPNVYGTGLEGSNPFGKGFGWKCYPVNFQGHDLWAIEAPSDPIAWRRVLFCPNHLRAWRSEFYDQIGGHDASLALADDHDLVMRSYIAGGNCVRIPECLYFYRVHKTQNVFTQNAKIQELDEVVYDRHIYRLCEKIAQSTPYPLTEEERNRPCPDCGGAGEDLGHESYGGPPCVKCSGTGKFPVLGRADGKHLGLIDLCGGINTAPGYTPWDISLGHDLNQRWPADDSTVGVLRAFDALEHLTDKIHTMNEAWRVLAPGGVLLVMVPSTDAMIIPLGEGKSELINGSGAYCDPTHVSFWNQMSFRYYTDKFFQKYVPAITARFQVSRLQTINAGGIPYVRAELIALKPGHSPMGTVLC